MMNYQGNESHANNAQNEQNKYNLFPGLHVHLNAYFVYTWNEIRKCMYNTNSSLFVFVVYCCAFFRCFLVNCCRRPLYVKQVV